MDLSFSTRAPLNDGRSMPVLGLGMWDMSRREAEGAVIHALRSGYRLFDTAKLYGNEAELGRAIRAGSIPRDQVFITTKLWNDDHGYERTFRAFDRSFQALDLGYVDLYLIHWPVRGLRAESWKALQKIQTSGRARSIGVSNYTVRHLEELMAESAVVPAVNQVEFHPWLYQEELLTFCAKHGIVVEAYSPLTKGRRLRDPFLMEVATKYGRSPAQVLIRWSLQHGLVVIPKSSHPSRIEENARVFDFALSAADVARLDSLHEDEHTSWNPNRAA